MGVVLSFGYKAHNNFGRAAHERFLLRRPGRYKLTREEKKHLAAMMKALEGHAVVRKIMSCCPIREKRKRVVLNGVKVGYTPDAHGSVIMADLKTTVCRTFKDFIQAAFEYGYFRQGKQYGMAVGTREYWIIGIRKNPPYKVFLIPTHDKEYKLAMNYVERELEFLLYFFQNYGNPNYKWKKAA